MKTRAGGPDDGDGPDAALGEHRVRTQSGPAEAGPAQFVRVAPVVECVEHVEHVQRIDKAVHARILAGHEPPLVQRPQSVVAPRAPARSDHRVSSVFPAIPSLSRTWVTARVIVG
ncbi:hypothetical protein [Streptomyces sp. NPDC050287]|uniref:hypothetical protein n=1 Tax=Streptomyces sp. NPDC050287 TaxID=3365608 RepID=UPI0037A98DD6